MSNHRLRAWLDLLGHYKKTWVHFWAQRKTLDGHLFNEQEAEFLPAALSLQEQPISSSARLTARVLVALVAIALAWSVFGKMDIIVNAAGKVIPSGYSKTIASVDVASVRALNVQDGQSVKAGDVLIELDTIAADAERDKAQGDESTARLQVARSTALIKAVDTGSPPQLSAMEGMPSESRQAAQRHVSGQYQDFRAKLNRIQGDISRFEAELPLATQRASDYKILARDRDVSEHAWIEKEQIRMDIKGQLQNARDQRAALIEQTKKEAHDTLNDGSRIAAASTQDARKAQQRGNLLSLRSPVDGTVQQLTVHTVGGVVEAAKPLMLIVPRQTQVEVEAFLENKDIGFVQEGQAAEVKIDAFEYSKFGTVPAKVTHVSRDAIQDEKKGLIYAVRITLAKNTINVEGKELPLSAGMSVNVEIKTGTRRVIEYILSPLMQHGHESLSER